MDRNQKIEEVLQLVKDFLQRPIENPEFEEKAGLMRRMSLPNISKIISSIIDLKYDRDVDGYQEIHYKVWDKREIEDFALIPIRSNDSPKARLEVMTELMDRISSRIKIEVQHYEEAMKYWEMEETERKEREAKFTKEVDDETV